MKNVLADIGGALFAMIAALYVMLIVHGVFHIVIEVVFS
ncbi:putative membrane protein [Collimonas pratensis]|uniref:Membrane protein n=1 Tax=Collimonas pratensis TaxID=279113 RepID=A0ABM5Z4K6_9BURK|nr:putative membrane protein [Collimonas pratensis]